MQPDVPRALDVGLLAATGDRRFRHPKVELATPARDKAGRTFVYVEGRTAAAAKEAVARVGGKVTHTSGKRLRAAVPGKALAELAGKPGIDQVRQPDRAFPMAIASEGVESSGAGAWIRDGKRGAGVKVGVIDVGFDGLTDAQAAGELPAGTELRSADCPVENVSPHGTAVAEVVHDMAPDASLYLACAPDSLTFAAAADWLTAQGVQVITASIGFPNTGRGDGSGAAGTPSAAVQRSREAGVLWVTAAGNQAHLHWSAAAVDADADGYVEVNGTAEGNGFTVPAGGTATVSLKWDAWPTTRKDLDLIVMSANRQPTGSGDTSIVAQSTNAQADAAQPLAPTEQVTIENTSGGAQTYWIYTAARVPYADTRADLVVTGDATSLSYPVAAGSVLEPASSPYAMAVGASQIGSGRIDDYSSRGPTVDGRTKPDIAGPSGVSTLTYGQAPTFAGTSVATAHVAGAAALLKGANGDLDASQLQALLEERTQPAKFDNQWGHGLLALGPPDAPQGAATSGYTPLQLPRRILDTSSTIGGHNTPLTAGEVFTIPVADLPGDATAVAVTITGWAPNRTHLDVYRDPDSYTGVSTVELGANEKRSTMAIVPLAAARTITLRNDAGAANANIDLLGYFSPTSSGTYTAKDAPQRILDTRSALGGHNTALTAGEVFALPLGQWNSYDIRVSGKRITVRLNDVVVNDFVAPSTTRLLNPAFIGIQGSLADGEVWFRNIRVRVDQAAARFGAIAGATGKCVDVINSGKETGTQLQAITCKGNDAQRFTLPGDGTVRIFGLCLDANGPNRSSTSKTVVLWTCNGTSMQQFVMHSDGTIRNPNLETCLDDPTSDVLYTGRCHGAVNQQWAVPDIQARFGAVIGYQGKCMDVTTAATTAGAQVQAIACKGNGAQQITIAGDGTLRMFGLCLDTNGPIRSGTNRWVQTQTCNGTAAQQWVQRPDATLFAPASGTCLDDSGDRLYTGPCHARSNQQWAIPAAGPDGAVVADSRAELVAAWSADENNGTTLADRTGNGRTATLKGGTAWTTGHTGSAASFNGTTGEATATPAALQTDRSYSVSAWLRTSKTTNYPAAVSQEGAQRSSFLLRVAPDPEQWEFAVSTDPASGAHTRVGSGAGSVTLDRWTHLVGVYDAAAGKARLYVDGELKNSLEVPKLWHATGPTV